MKAATQSTHCWVMFLGAHTSRSGYNLHPDDGKPVHNLWPIINTHI